MGFFSKDAPQDPAFRECQTLACLEAAIAMAADPFRVLSVTQIGVLQTAARTAQNPQLRALAQRALDATLRYMGERHAFGQPINQFQGLQFRLAEMRTELAAARLLLRQAAWKFDNAAPDATVFCAVAKLFVTETGSRVADQCLQLHGGYGYLADYGIERIVRDLRVHQILEGTNEIMRVIISREMFRQ